MREVPDPLHATAGRKLDATRTLEKAERLLQRARTANDGNDVSSFLDAMGEFERLKTDLERELSRAEEGLFPQLLEAGQTPRPH